MKERRKVVGLVTPMLHIANRRPLADESAVDKQQELVIRRDMDDEMDRRRGEFDLLAQVKHGRVMTRGALCRDPIRGQGVSRLLREAGVDESQMCNGGDKAREETREASRH
ncbi:MAG: hypothetical protein NVSMB62_20790 [Acidobacteriaceae bacterium]